MYFSTKNSMKDIEPLMKYFALEFEQLEDMLDSSNREYFRIPYINVLMTEFKKHCSGNNMQGNSKGRISYRLDLFIHIVNTKGRIKNNITWKPIRLDKKVYPFEPPYIEGILDKIRELYKDSETKIGRRMKDEIMAFDRYSNYVDNMNLSIKRYLTDQGYITYGRCVFDKLIYRKELLDIIERYRRYRKHKLDYSSNSIEYIDMYNELVKYCGK